MCNECTFWFKTLFSQWIAEYRILNYVNPLAHCLLPLSNGSALPWDHDFLFSFGANSYQVLTQSALPPVALGRLLSRALYRTAQILALAQSCLLNSIWASSVRFYFKPEWDWWWLAKSLVISLKRSKPGYCIHLRSVVTVGKLRNQIFHSAVCGGVHFASRLLKLSLKGPLIWWLLPCCWQFNSCVSLSVGQPSVSHRCVVWDSIFKCTRDSEVEVGVIFFPFEGSILSHHELYYVTGRIFTRSCCLSLYRE